MERIGKVSDRVAYLILVSLCDDDSTIRYKAEQQLDKFDAPSAGDGAIVKTEGTKRKADSDSDLMVCVDCKGVFSEQTRRGRSVCRFHNGASNTFPLADVGRSHFLFINLLTTPDVL